MASTIHFKKHLIHQAAVRRNSPAQSASGELIPSYSTAGTIDLRYVEKQERIADESQGLMMLERHIALVGAGTDVIEEDQIANITLRATGAVVEAGPFSIESVRIRNRGNAHHISLELERIE